MTLSTVGSRPLAHEATRKGLNYFHATCEKFLWHVCVFFGLALSIEPGVISLVERSTVYEVQKSCVVLSVRGATLIFVHQQMMSGDRILDHQERTHLYLLLHKNSDFVRYPDT